MSKISLSALLSETRKRLHEDDVDDKLADLSKAFDTADVPTYVTKLQQYLSEPKVAAVLKAGHTDAAGPADEKMSAGEGSLSVSALKPTQNEIGAAESLKNILTDEYGSLEGFLKGNASFPSPVITYNSEWILDGHHRWSQVYAANPDAKIPVLNIKGNLKPEQILKAVHAAIAATSGEDKTRAANLKAGNLLAFTRDKVITYVSEQLTDKARDVWNKNGFADDTAIANRIADNVEQMISQNGPESWAPKRDFMPQPGDNNADNFDDLLSKGIVNYNEPV